MRRFRLVIPWLVLIVCGAGFVIGQFGYVAWPWGSITLDIRCGSVRAVWMREALLGSMFRKPAARFGGFGTGRRFYGYRWDEPKRPGSYAFIGFAWEHVLIFGSPLYGIAIPLWFPALLAGLWLVRRRFKRRGRLKGFEVLPAAAGARAGEGTKS